MDTKMIEGRVRGHPVFVEGADLNPTANKKGCMYTPELFYQSLLVYSEIYSIMIEIF